MYIRIYNESKRLIIYIYRDLLFIFIFIFIDTYYLYLYL